MNRLFVAKAFGKLRCLLSESPGYFFPLAPVLLNLSLKPRQIDFETTNICNASCVFCGYRYMQRPKGIMSMDIFKKALGDFIDIGGGDLGFTPIAGDPFMDNLILERLRYARSFPEIRKIGLCTNAIALDKFEAKEILTSGLDTISISFGGFNRISYKKIFGVDEFEHAYKNIISLANANKKLNHPVKIALGLKIDRSLKDIAKEPYYQKIASSIGNIKYQYRFDSWSGRIRQEDLFGIMRIKKPTPKREPCAAFYGDGPTVFYNGDVTLCGCRDLEAEKELCLGNIMSNSLISMWRSEKLNTLRKDFFKAIVPKICINCSHYNGVKLFSGLSYRQRAKENYKLFSESRYARGAENKLKI